MILFWERALWQVRSVVSSADPAAAHFLIVFFRSRFLIGARIKGSGTLGDKKVERSEHTTPEVFAQTRYTWRDLPRARKF
jgi:hypothetical protein